jgi:DNA-binding beta-propeller fold protein YncE
MKKLSAVLSLLLFGCGDKLDDPRTPTGSQTIATSSDYSALYIANTAENTVTRLPIDGTPVEVAVEGEPSRVARIDERVFVTLRANRAIAVMVDDGAGLAVDQTIPTGAEPIGIVASEDGKRLFVAASLEGKVYEYDATSLAEVRSWDVKDEPRWLALHPSGVLYVASAYNGTFTYINLDSGIVHETRLPDVVQRSDELGDDVELDRRITGDVAISADGQYLAVPAMYFDTATPVIEADATEVAVPVDARPVEASGYASGGTNQRFNALVAVAQIEGDGEPQIEDAELVRISAADTTEGFSIQGYPASVTISPDSATTYVTIEGGRGVAAFPTSRADDDFDNSVLSASFDEADQALGGRSFTQRTVVAAATDNGPRGIAFTGPREAFVYNFLDRTVQQVDVAGYQDQLYDGDSNFQFTATIGRPMIVSRVAIDPQVDLGRRLFYATNDSKMSAGGIGLSCATCHFDGRADGLTWMFDRGPRQTPSLAGKVSLTEPVRWGAERATVADDVRQTSQGLMGGFGITDQDVAAVAAFVDSSRDVDAPLKGSTDLNVLAGKALFERSDVACISCHNGPRFTNNQQYDLFGFEGVDTRSLIGIAGSPPYLHDGRAKTLREVLEISRSGAMGNTSALSDDEMFQLESYLRSL